MLSQENWRTRANSTELTVLSRNSDGGKYAVKRFHGYNSLLVAGNHALVQKAFARANGQPSRHPSAYILAVTRKEVRSEDVRTIKKSDHCWEPRNPL